MNSRESFSGTADGVVGSADVMNFDRSFTRSIALARMKSGRHTEHSASPAGWPDTSFQGRKAGRRKVNARLPARARENVKDR